MGVSRFVRRTGLQPVAVTIAVALGAALTGCSSPRPRAPFLASVRDATLETTLRIDADDAVARRMAADQIRLAQGILSAALGPPAPQQATVWLLGQEHLARYLERVGRSENTGAATIVSSRSPEVFTHRPSRTATPEGDAAQRLHSRFVLTHEYTHAWLNTRLNSELEEGFANWVAVRSLRGVADGGVTLEGAERMATSLARLSARLGDPVTVDDLLDARGEAAYVYGTALFLWLDEERKDDQAFRTLVASAVSPFGIPGQGVLQAGLREASPPAEPDSRFAAWLDATDARRRSWWVALGYVAIGSAADGAAILADDEPIIAMSFADPAALPPDAAALDAAHGRPPLDRVTDVEVTFRLSGSGAGGDATASLGLVATGGDAPGELGLLLVRRGGTIRVTDGDRLRLLCEGSTVRLLRGTTELHRWPEAACQLFSVGGRGLGPSDRPDDGGVLPVIEVRRRRETAPTRG